MHGRIPPGATAESREVDGRTVYIGRSLPIRIRYEAEWGEPDGTGLPIVRFFYRDRWLNTWAVGARAHLNGWLDRALGGRVRLRVYVSRFTDEGVEGSMYAQPVAQPERGLLLGPFGYRPDRSFGPDEGPRVAIDTVLRGRAPDHGHYVEVGVRLVLRGRLPAGLSAAPQPAAGGANRRSK